MNKFEIVKSNTGESIVTHLRWITIFLVASTFAGCGSGGGNPVLGGVDANGASGSGSGASGSGISTVVSQGAVCSTAGATIPTVTGVEPSDGNQFVTTSTNGVAGSGKVITATFSLAMNAASINSASFTLTPAVGAALTPASISYSASTKLATFTTSAALLTNTTYNALISTAAISAAGIPMSCSVKWSFKTAATASVGLAPVNLGTATSFGIASAAGLTNTPTTPLTHINGDVVLDPLATCNAVAVDAVGGFGLCNGMAPTITGTVISPLFNLGTTSASIKADLNTAYLNLMPAKLPGATVLGCGTIGASGGAGTLVGCAGNATIPPGVYISATSSSIGVTGVLTLDGQGDSNARFVFQAPSTLTTAAGAVGAPGSQIVLINGAKASNVWWQVGSSATIGTYAVFNGNILADTSITMGTSSTSCGRLLAGAVTTSGAFTFDSNVISVPGNSSAPAGCK